MSITTTTLPGAGVDGITQAGGTAVDGTLQYDPSMDTLKVMTGNSWLPITTGSGGIGNGVITDRTLMWDPQQKHAEILDKFEMNQVVVEHKVAEHELMKLKTDQPDYAEHIKQNLAKTATTQILNKMSFTKKRNMDTDVNHFIGRVWVFNKDEMETLIKEIRNA